jgi:hypothetical protein
MGRLADLEQANLEWFDQCDEDVYDTWKRSSVGILKFHRILCGVSGRFEHKERFWHPIFDEIYDPDESDDDTDIVSARPHLLACHQWNAYFEWLCLNEENSAADHRFMVVRSHLYSFLMSSFYDVSLVYTKTFYREWYQGIRGNVSK